MNKIKACNSIVPHEPQTNRVQIHRVPNICDDKSVGGFCKCDNLDLIQIANRNHTSSLKSKLKSPTSNPSCSIDDTLKNVQLVQVASVVLKKPVASISSKVEENVKEINLDHFKSSKKVVKNSTLVVPDEAEKIKDRIAQAEIILEAMGNACTARNENSSRFVSLKSFLVKHKV